MLNKEMRIKIHRENLAEFDRRISGLESDLERVNEERREYINRNDLNKDGTLKPEVEDEEAGTV
ncbi:type I restriction-modification enzyme [Kosakonia phage Kc283]|uniref:Type I restriction-modification enzyme n=1 Tax=Kosakonia phage Kc283 TaxID=2863195 RepID=A0AAE7WF02_9CAUD|nr:type I restriction-modification enzyme [Kosakonia phage Kc283]QYN79841.1 type I restriction-modification enzyme [Kosakonia phage Kc283]